MSYFDRLNSGGSNLTHQEIRQAIYRNKKPNSLKLIDELSEYDNFKKLINLSNRKEDESYNKELVLRFFSYKDYADKFEEYGKGSIKIFLDKVLLEKIDEKKIVDYEKRFKDFFDFLNNLESNDIFRHKNGFSIAKYEAIVIGLEKPVSKDESKDFFINKIDKLADQEWFKESIDKNSFAKKRLKCFLADDNVKNYFKER